MARVHEIEHQIHGDDMQFVEIELDPGEGGARRGRRHDVCATMCMEDGIEMETIFGDAWQPNASFLGALAGRASDC